MRIGLVVPGGVDPSATDRVLPFLVWLVRRLAARHDVRILSLAQGHGARTYEWCGATVHDLGLAGVKGRARRALMLPRIWRATASMGPLDIVHGFWLGFPGLTAALVARRLGVPSLVSLCGGELVSLADIGYGGGRTARSRLLTRASLRLATGATAAAGDACRRIRALGFAVDQIPLGVDASWVADSTSDTQARAGGLPFRLLHVAHLNEVKDQATLIDAFATLVARVPATLDVIGEDTLGGRVQRRAIDRGVASLVTFHGAVPFADMPRHYARADLLVHASRHEAGPLVVLEAAMHGVPAVGTAVGHVADWAPDRAVAVPPADPLALADGMAALLVDETRRRAMAEAAQNWARTHDADWTCRRFEALYDRLITEGASSSRPRHGSSRSAT